MPIHILDDKLVFPPAHLAEPDGLLAIGGDLSVERLLLAYRKGIFPWYEGQDILWWSPSPRFVLFPDELNISKSMKQVLRNDSFRFTVNRAFSQVIHHCKETFRPGQDGTWITDDVENAYKKLHELGHAHSAEAWRNGELLGGLYGIKMGNVFFGESMFAHASNASKYAFIKLVQLLQSQGVQLIDCQVHTPHLESLGARMIEGEEFQEYLTKYIVI